MFRSLAFLAAISFALPCLAGGKPLPDDAALQSAKRVIIDTFRQELSASDKVPAIKAMLETAEKTEGDDAGQAALYLSAADVAARAGETRLAFDALERLSQTFDVDLLAVKLTVLEAAAKYAKSNDARVSVANRALELADDATRASRFDVADDALKTAASVSSKVRDADLRKDITAKRKDMEKARRQSEHAETALAAARKTLKEKPNDPDANEAMGKHLAFDKNDWTAGLKHLVLSGDSGVSKAAKADQAGANSPTQSMSLGDYWWSIADASENQHDKAGYRSRAVFWYTRSVSSLTGLQKARVEKRIAEAGDLALSQAADQTGGENGKFVDVTLAPGVLIRMVKIPASKDGKAKEFYLGQTEVTQKQWQAVMGSNPSTVKGDSLPVTDVSQKDCMAFAAKLSAKGRYEFRLPTKEEWLHAYELDVKAGQANVNALAWHKDNASGKMHDVGGKQPGSLGLLDVAGNAFELTADPSHIYGGSIGTPIPSDGTCFTQDFPSGDKHLSVGFRVLAQPR